MAAPVCTDRKTSSLEVSRNVCWKVLMTRDASGRMRMWRLYCKGENEIQSMAMHLSHEECDRCIAQFLAAKTSTNRLLCPALISRVVRGRLDLSGMAGQFLLHQPLRHSILDACFRNNDCERVSAKDESVAEQGQPHMPFTSVLPLAFLVHERGLHESSDNRIPERAPRGTAHGRRALHPPGRSAGNLRQVTQQRLCGYQGRHLPCARQAAGTFFCLA